MDIIATGISSSTTEKVKGVIEIVKNIAVDFHDKVRKQGINYDNLSEFVEKKLREEALAARRPMNEKLMQDTELREALRQLEEDAVIQLFGNSRNPTIRFIY
jgi:hypothetical protein